MTRDMAWVALEGERLQIAQMYLGSIILALISEASMKK